MADALLFAGTRGSRSYTRINWNVHLVLDLLAPALLLGIWRAWASAMAPRLDIYFSAEALLIGYAYFAVVRAVFLNAHSYDRSGRYSRTLALHAARDFRSGLQRYWPKLAIAALSVLLAAFALDVLTAHSGVQNRPNVHLTILFVEIMIWARYGAAIVLTAARWRPPQVPAFAEARELADTTAATRSFALVNIGYGVAALAAVAGYKWLGASLPSARAELIASAVVFTGLALLALRLQCRWARMVLPQLKARSNPDVLAPVLQRAA